MKKMYPFLILFSLMALFVAGTAIAAEMTDNNDIVASNTQVAEQTNIAPVAGTTQNAINVEKMTKKVEMTQIAGNSISMTKSYENVATIDDDSGKWNTSWAKMSAVNDGTGSTNTWTMGEIDDDMAMATLNAEATPENLSLVALVVKTLTAPMETILMTAEDVDIADEVSGVGNSTKVAVNETATGTIAMGSGVESHSTV